MRNKINYEKLLEGVKSVIERGDYEKFLKMIKKFKNNYSFRNMFLVYSQNPRATLVKGFVDWQKFGRGIKKHPRTIYIYAPMGIRKNKAITGQQKVDGNEEKERKEGSTIEIIDNIKYRRIAVYDIRDTYVKKGAKKIPFIEDFIDNNTTERLYKILKSISPVPIEIKTIIGGSKGYYSKKENKIVLEESLSQDDKTAVLIHELCHCLYDDFCYEIDRDKSEIFVESVAFLVADYFGFDTSICSFGYITNWAKNDIKKFLSLSNKIKDIADEYISLINNADYKQEKISA